MEGFQYPGKHIVNIAADLVIGYAQDVESVGRRPFVAHRITLRLLRVDFTVHLDDQCRGMAIEVGNERPNVVLTAELRAAKPAVAKALPDNLLGGSLAVPQFSRTLKKRIRYAPGTSGQDGNVILCCHAGSPHPSPLPREREHVCQIRYVHGFTKA